MLQGLHTEGIFNALIPGCIASCRLLILGGESRILLGNARIWLCAHRLPNREALSQHLTPRSIITDASPKGEQ